MEPNRPLVLLVVAEGAPRDSLASTAEELSHYGVPFREDGSFDQLEGVHLVVVASVEQQTPALWAKTGVPTVRVPVAARDASTAERLALLVPTDGEESGVGFATLAIGVPGARNAALFAVAMLAAQGDEELGRKLLAFRRRQSEMVQQQVVTLSPGLG